MSVIMQIEDGQYLSMLDGDQVVTTAFFEDAMRFDSILSAQKELKKIRKIKNQELKDVSLVRGL